MQPTCSNCFISHFRCHNLPRKMIKIQKKPPAINPMESLNSQEVNHIMQISFTFIQICYWKLVVAGKITSWKLSVMQWITEKSMGRNAKEYFSLHFITKNLRAIAHAKNLQVFLVATTIWSCTSNLPNRNDYY